MRPRFFTAPVAAVAALVLLGATVGGLVLANQASSPPAAPDPAPTAAPAPTATPEPAPTATAVPPQPAADPDPGAGTQPAPTVVPAQPAPDPDPGTGKQGAFELPPLPAKTVEVEVEVVSGGEGSPSPSGQASRAEREAAAAAIKSQQGRVFTWQDGDRTLGAVLQDDLVVQDTASIKADDVVVVEGGNTSIVEGRAGNSGAEPVFRSESGGELMTLPGGVLLALDADWDQSQVDDFFERNGISADRVSELDFITNGFVVETEPGFPSLELANALAGQDGVTVSSPNWWREVQAK